MNLKLDDFSYTLVKKSIDSREKPNILFIYSVDIELKNKKVDIKKPQLAKHKAKFIEPFEYIIPEVPKDPAHKRPIVV